MAAKNVDKPISDGAGVGKTGHESISVRRRHVRFGEGARPFVRAYNIIL